jgi:hypothetical protein
MLGDLGVPGLRSIKTMTSFFFSFLEHQTSHVVCFNARGLLYECVFDALFVFLVVPTCWETRFSSHRYSTYFFFSSSFLDHHTGHPSRHDVWILLMSASSLPSEFFNRRFDLLEAYFL